ncbi:DHS-like NAD/FAD-binding domain-containing protein [Microdochium trichocladiopsis]|uniref:DHS-like NAD/FAD-binding domain-containing protein n=1 Tax=Microdochium trichocladiopsis TaxID=1682393 RepID=A0A9P8XXX0_9PEZI|nr:DHS-like NAD/FAD-binding domain-containing protein [Microdochium trichocladiopsis]KAH7021030.1 DHS-like NAD/FAD-binding domain-containing protein [Microdochium trichocladiopsis]
MQQHVNEAPAVPVKRKPGRPRKHPLPPGTAPVERPAVAIKQVRSSASPVDQDAIAELEERVLDLSDSWETESLYADAIEDLTQDKQDPGNTAVIPSEEAAVLRQQLRTLGPVEFYRRHIESGDYAAKRLITAFGVKPPAFLEGCDDDAYFQLLTLAMTRELQKRVKLVEYSSVDDAVRLIQRARNIIVLTGAGISTSLGIPDFRSKATGLYSQLEKMGLGINDPQEVFNIDVFREDPSIFYSVARNILPDDAKVFTPTHKFIAMLQDRNKLLTNYSQNIDNIEANAGIKPEHLVQCHGSFATATCQRCGYKLPGHAIFAEIKADTIPRCPSCIAKLRARGLVKRKRQGNSRSSSRRGRGQSDDDSDDDYNIPTAGVMKPDITFFGENLPDEFANRLAEDRGLVDLVIVIGTSLKVAPVSEVASFLPPNVPQIYISRTPVNHINFDIDMLGDCDVVVAELCRRLGWDLQHSMIPSDQLVLIEREEGYDNRHRFTEINQNVIKRDVTILPDLSSTNA